jgi:hypothetical protein
MPILTKVKKNTGLSGLAEVRVLAAGLRVIFKADGDTYDVNPEGWDRPSGLYNITLNRTQDQIKYVSPPGPPARTEPFMMKFLEFGNRVGRDDNNPGIPEPKVKPAEVKQWQGGGSSYIPESLVTSAKLVVVEKGPYKGLTTPYEVPYIFEQYPGSMLTMLVGTKYQNKRVEDFLRINGMDLLNEEIPWSANVLPFLETRLQASNAVFSVQLNEKGFVAKDGIRAIPSFLITPEMLGEEEEAPKKKAPSKAKPTNGKVKKATRK